MKRQSIQFILLPLLFILWANMACMEPKGEKQEEDHPFRIIDRSPSWSPDGRAIVYYHSQSIDSTGKWSPDTSGLYLIDPDGTNKRLLRIGFTHDPNWSPDSKWVVFEERGEIYKIKANGDSLFQLTFEGRNFYPDWSPDGTKITYDRSVSDQAGKSGIWLINSNGSERKWIFGGAFPTWHPDGKNIIAVIGVSPVGGWKKFIRYNINESVVQETLSVVVGNSNEYPKYSPNGNKILFISQPYGNRHQLWVMDSDGENQIQLTQDGGWTGDWAPSGESIVFTNALDGRLWIMNAYGAHWRQLTFKPE